MVKRALALAVLLLVLPPGVAGAEPCDQSVMDCDLAGQDETLVLPVEVRMVTAMVPLRSDRTRAALAAYRRLIPKPYAMPAFPAVGLELAEVTVPAFAMPDASVPGVETHWFEGSVGIRVMHGDEEGWFNLAMPVSSAFQLELGRGWGLPKYLAEMSMSELNDYKTLDSVVARARIAAGATMSLQWVEHPLRFAPNYEDWGRGRDPLFTRSPALNGSGAMRVKYTPKPYAPVFDFAAAPSTTLLVAPATALAPLRAGLVSYRIDPTVDDLDDALPDVFPRGLSLASLIRPGGTAVGAYVTSAHLLIVQARTLA